MARPKSFTLPPHSVPRRVTDPVVGVLARLGVSPNHLTVLGFLGNVGAAALAARGEVLSAGLVVLVAGAPAPLPRAGRLGAGELRGGACAGARPRPARGPLHPSREGAPTGRGPYH